MWAGGVRPFAVWEGRFTVTSQADGLLGAIAILLSREIGQGYTSYRCTVCGTETARGRPPRPDEAIYCERPACKREQRRRNQAAWRARQGRVGQ